MAFGLRDYMDRGIEIGETACPMLCSHAFGACAGSMCPKPWPYEELHVAARDQESHSVMLN